MTSRHKDTVELGTVQETMLITLWARAVDAHKRQPILNDRKSAEIMDRLDYDFGRFGSAKGSQVDVCIRALQFDAWVKEFLREHPDGTVVEIGAGLNTRFERVDNGRVRWFDLDLPDAMDLRMRFFQENDRRSFISASVLDDGWLHAVRSATRGQVLLVAEGVFMYFEEADVRRVFSRLADSFPDSILLFDSMSTWWVQNQQQHDSPKLMDATVRWGIDHVEDLQWWGERYALQESLTVADVAHRCPRRVPLHIRVLADVLGLLFRRQKRGYRVNRVRLGAPSAAVVTNAPMLVGRA